ncbi:hypothetical protein [Agathobaculum sp.]|uniref:hypothetical protein n=1 Tax=Agathobaculum sp. TaxID=2048138 RepID=UPI00399FBF42
MFQPVEKVPAPPRASNRQLRLAAISLIISCGLVSRFAGRLYDKMGIKALFVMHPEKSVPKRRENTGLPVRQNQAPQKVTKTPSFPKK